MKQLLHSLRKSALLITFILGIFVAPEKAKSQVYLGIGSGGLMGLNDTIYEYDTILVSLYINNYGPSVFNGNFVLEAYLQDTALQALVYFDSLSIPNLLINPYDSLFLQIPWIVHTQNTNPSGPLRIGNNLIVVWPASSSSGVFTIDSLLQDVFVADTITDVNPVPRIEAPNVYFYFSNQSQLLHFKPGPDLLEIRHVDILDVMGRVIYRKDGHPDFIDVDSWSRAIYFVDLTFGNGSRRTYKIVKN